MQRLIPQEDLFFVLGRNTFLDIFSVLAMPRLALRPMVLLSACETAGDAGAGDSAEFFSLGSAFLSIGARAVVASMVNVLDEVSSTFFTFLLRRLLAGDVVTDAYCCALSHVNDLLPAYTTHEKSKNDTNYTQNKTKFQN